MVVQFALVLSDKGADLFCNAEDILLVIAEAVDMIPPMITNFGAIHNESIYNRTNAVIELAAKSLNGKRSIWSKTLNIESDGV